MAEDGSSQNNERRLFERLDELEQLLRMHASRLHAIEQRLGLEYRPPVAQTRERPPIGEARAAATGEAATPPKHSAQDAPETGQQREQAPRPGAGTQARSGDAERATSQSHTATAAGARGWFDLEAHIGGSWFNWLAIIAVTFAVAFFLKEAFENEWIGATARIMLGAATGLGILFVADRLRVRGLRQYAYVLSGGGILILYLSVYAAFAFYNLIGQALAFLLMVLVTATAASLAARHDALPIAMLGLIGGFLTPLLLSTGQDNEAVLFTYVALLDAGVLTLAYFKQWRSLNHMSFIATLLTALGWTMLHYAPAKLWLTIFFLSLFFVLFSMLAVVHNVLRRRPSRWPDISLIISNATFYFGMSYWMLDEANYDAVLGSFALLVSAFYLLLYYFAHSRHRLDRLLVYSLLGAAITFFTTAVAIQLEQQWVTMAWAVEAVVLTWVGLRSETSAPRHAALFVFAVAVLHWLSHDLFDFAYGAGSHFIPFINARAASCAVLVGACAATIKLYRHTTAQKISEDERSIILTLFVLAANALALMLLTFDVNDYFRQQIASLPPSTTSYSDEWTRLDSARHFVLTATWTLYATTALIVGLLRRIQSLRLLALALLAAAIIKALLYDAGYYDASWHAPLFNQTFFAFALLVAALAVAARAYSRAGGEIAEGERARVFPALVVVANLLALFALSAEASGYFESKIRMRGFESKAVGDLRLAQQLALSVIWTIYGGAMLMYGHLRGHRLLRLMALLLLGATTLKVFFWDLASLNGAYRIVSFLVLGLILLAVSYLYQRRRQQAAEAEA